MSKATHRVISSDLITQMKIKENVSVETTFIIMTKYFAYKYICFIGLPRPTQWC